MDKKTAIIDRLKPLAESYNIDITSTHNTTDAEYCQDKMRTICDVATVCGITTDIQTSSTGQISRIFVGNERVDIPQYEPEESN